ncbi:hypothetical protein Bca101_053994 [Brassica carinata]
MLDDYAEFGEPLRSNGKWLKLDASGSSEIVMAFTLKLDASGSSKIVMAFEIGHDAAKRGVLWLKSLLSLKWTRFLSFSLLKLMADDMQSIQLVLLSTIQKVFSRCTCDSVDVKAKGTL